MLLWQAIVSDGDQPLPNKLTGKQQQMNESTEKEKILAFLSEIGIPVKTAELKEETFLPGIMVDHGVILIDDD
jgi:hypothetical protein